MARSVLPANARARKAARQAKRCVHGAVRAAERAALATAPRDDGFDERAPRSLDAQHGAHDGIRAVVLRRRQADKVGPLLRWAEANAAELGREPADRVARLRSLLPDGLIGEHALLHLAWLEAFDVDPNASWRRWWRDRDVERAAQDRAAASLRDRLRHRLAQRADAYGELNALLKAQWPSDDGAPVTGRRLLAGLHDVDAFVAEVTITADRRGTLRCAAHPGQGCGCWSVRRARLALVAAWCELA